VRPAAAPRSRGSRRRSPVTIANWVNSGQLVLLTTGFGHAFYIGTIRKRRPATPSRIIGPVTFSTAAASSTT
jgi:hypothetical protein